jgi:MioC protein
MGAAEYIADEIAEALQNKGYEATVHEQPNIEEIPLQGVYWLICTSTHGAGDLPDNIQSFIADLELTSPLLSDIEYGVIGLGSTSYDTFCSASHKIDALLTKFGAKKKGKLLEIDVLDDQLPEDYALSWLPSWLHTLT